MHDPSPHRAHVGGLYRGEWWRDSFHFCRVSPSILVVAGVWAQVWGSTASFAQPRTISWGSRESVRPLLGCQLRLPFERAFPRVSRSSAVVSVSADEPR
eukprot:7017902-Lingulodinium_polyedra.AAC.1